MPWGPEPWGLESDCLSHKHTRDDKTCGQGRPIKAASQSTSCLDPSRLFWSSVDDGEQERCKIDSLLSKRTSVSRSNPDALGETAIVMSAVQTRVRGNVAMPEQHRRSQRTRVTERSWQACLRSEAELAQQRQRGQALQLAIAIACRLIPPEVGRPRVTSRKASGLHQCFQL